MGKAIISFWKYSWCGWTWKNADKKQYLTNINHDEEKPINSNYYLVFMYRKLETKLRSDFNICEAPDYPKLSQADNRL